MKSGSNPSDRRQMILSLVGLAVSGGVALSGCDTGATPGPRLGDRFPAFSIPDLQGRLHDSRTYEGRPLMINFWATWCPPCRLEMADLERLQRALAPEGLVLLTISIDSDLNLVKEFVRREQLTLSVLVDANQNWSRTALKMPALPTSYLIGDDFRIKEVVAGTRAWADPPVQQSLAARVGIKR